VKYISVQGRRQSDQGWRSCCCVRLVPGSVAPDAWKAQQLTLIEQAKKPRAGLLLMVAAPIQQLIEASDKP
jgi:hypothetical protein